MDLFSDIPEPNPVSVRERKQVLAHRRIILPTSGSDLFGDLPLPSTASCAATSSPSNVSSPNDKGTKRKIPDEEVTSIPVPAEGTDLYEVHGFVAERKGEREDMQDSHIIINDFHKRLNNIHPSINRLALYAVFDGHGGVQASKFARTQIPTIMAAKLSKAGTATQIDKDMKRCFLECFKKTDEDFLKEAAKHKPSWKDGTTAIVVIILNNTLFISNLGDSKAILCRFNPDSKTYSAIPLSKDHSPTDYTERMRIQKAGGHVRDGRVLGSLEVSRSIGDGQFKTLGVSCIPDVKRCQLAQNDRFLVLACDGLWKVFTSEQVLEIVNETLKDDSIKVEGRRDEDLRCETACNKLANEAVRKLSGDNVTVIVALIRTKDSLS